MKKGKKQKTMKELTAGYEEWAKGRNDIIEITEEDFHKVLKKIVTTKVERPLKKKK